MKKKAELKALWHLVSALGALCRASPEYIVDTLSGCLWDEEEAGAIIETGNPGSRVGRSAVKSPPKQHIKGTKNGNN